jgi:hypothetical protein
MTSISFQNIASVLLEMFPEFRDSTDFRERDLEFPYSMWSRFAGYAAQRLHDNGPDDPIVARLFSFVNEQFTTPDSDPAMLDLIGNEIIPEFAWPEKALEYARQNTKGDARLILEAHAASPDPSLVPEEVARRQQFNFDQKQSTRGLYATKVLGIRAEKGDRKEFKLQDFRNVDTLETFLAEVSAGESVITPAGKSFLEAYFGMRTLAELLHKRGIVHRFLSNADTAERIFNWLENETADRRSAGVRRKPGSVRTRKRSPRRPRHRPPGRRA